jgi:hypothetical protein
MQDKQSIHGRDKITCGFCGRGRDNWLKYCCCDKAFEARKLEEEETQKVGQTKVRLISSVGLIDTFGGLNKFLQDKEWTITAYKAAEITAPGVLEIDKMTITFDKFKLPKSTKEPTETT